MRQDVARLLDRPEQAVQKRGQKSGLYHEGPDGMLEVADDGPTDYRLPSTSRISMNILFALLLAAQPPTSGAAPAPQPAPAARPAPQRRPAANATVEVRVTNRTGDPAPGAHVTFEGPSQRNGTTDINGLVTFRTMTPGAYRIRAEGEGLIALEKELAVKGGAPMTAEFALSAAPPPPAPAPAPEPPPPPPPPPTGDPGEARLVSIPDLAERSLSARNPVKIQAIGCSGMATARLLLVRDPVPSNSRDDADEMLYLVAGEAKLNLGETEETITPGSFFVVPRKTSYGITRRGRNPAILLSVVSGVPCTSAAGARQ
jgi:mannose-6-phosphate isomerase-like protein (cupin superfamily)